MSERVERKILALIGDDHVSPYGNPIPGLDELGSVGTDGKDPGLLPLHSVLGGSPGGSVTSVTVTVRRIGEPVQVDHEALGLLTAAGALPGGRVRVTSEGDRVIVVGVSSTDSQGVSLPLDVASHVFVDTVTSD